MGTPPVDAGAENVTVTWLFPAVTPVTVGAPGVVTGVTEAEFADGDPAPTPLLAVTENT
jgi:hypothetical protein